eukprot:10615864-Heterocapsa_arctica.AAC.1
MARERWTPRPVLPGRTVAQHKNHRPLGRESVGQRQADARQRRLAGPQGGSGRAGPSWAGRLLHLPGDG